MPGEPRATSGVAAAQNEKETPTGQALEEASRHFGSTNQKPKDSVQDEDSIQNPMVDDEMEEFLSGISELIQGAPTDQNAKGAVNAKASEKLAESIESEERGDTPQKPPVQRNNGRKRKSEEMGEEPAAPPSKKPAKKPPATKKAAPKAAAKQKVGPSVGYEFLAKLPAVQDAMPARLPGLIRDPNTHLSQRQQAELDQIIEKVKARPGKLKTLYVLKREKSQKTSADDVRSGRAIVKPLAYWNAEQCVHDEGGAAGLELGSRIPLNSIKEITRNTKTKGRSNDEDSDDDDDDAASLNAHHVDGHEEPWETEIGVFRGPAPGGPDDPRRTRGDRSRLPSVLGADA